jgi:predicted nucleic acid-binding protein
VKTAADSSFLVSCYSYDNHSEQATGCLAAHTDQIMITSLTILEVSSALCLKVFRRLSTEANTRAAIAAFDADVTSGLLTQIPVPPSVWGQARALALKQTPTFGARSLDILHVAIALAAKADSFLTFDRVQARLASAEGLATPIEID